MPSNNVTPLGQSLGYDENANRRAKATDELGLTGLKMVSGYTFEEFLPQLQGQKAIAVFREMTDNDPIVGSVLHAIDMLIRQVEWRIEPADDSQEAEREAEFVREAMKDMEHTWEEFISEALSMLTYGWSWFEMVYKRRGGEKKAPLWKPSEAEWDEPGSADNTPASSRFDDGRIGWRKFSLRSQDSWWRWETDNRNNVKGMWQSAAPHFQMSYIPGEKSLHFRTRSNKNNPEGRSVLRNAYRPWFFKKRLEEIEAVGLERDLAGYPVAFIPAEFLSEEADDDMKAVATLFEEAVRNTRRDAQEGLVLPQQYDPDTGNPLYSFQLLSTGGARTFNTDAIIQRYDQRIAMTLLADLILLGHEAVGSYALSTSKEGLLRASLTAWLDHIAAQLNTVELPRLWRLNGLPEETMPKFAHGEVDSPTPTELVSFVATLAGAGVPLFPNQELENHLLTVAKLPTRTEEEWQAAWDMAQQMQQQQGFDQEFEEEEEFAADDREEIEEEEFTEELGTEAGPQRPSLIERNQR